MGARARDYVEQHHTLEGFALNVRAAAEASLEGPRTGSRLVVDGRDIPHSTGARGLAPIQFAQVSHDGVPLVLSKGAAMPARLRPFRQGCGSPTTSASG
jgi:hypothetical protein